METLEQSIKKLKDEWMQFNKNTPRPSECINCNCIKIYWNGVRVRTASMILQDEVVHITDIECRRVKCSECNKGWTFRPPGLVSRKHYQLCIVANSCNDFLFNNKTNLSQLADIYCCSRRTVGRWLNWVAGIAEPSVLAYQLFCIKKNKFMSSFQTSTEQLVKHVISGKDVLTKAAQNLFLTEAISITAGYGSPGLKSVVEAVFFDRDRITTYQNPIIPVLAQ